jgi:protein-S-isoprenylcysteine O-methyltransferase Ste14
VQRLLVGLGRRLFRWRSALPLVLVPVAALAAALGPASAGPADVTLFAPGFLVLGLVLRAWVAGHAPARASMRNVHRFQADALSVHGPYSLVRHPIYVANVFVAAGLLLLLREPVATCVGIALIACIYAAIGAAEDAFLAERFGETHARWRARTPAFLPRTLRAARPPLAYSVRTVLRREHPTWLAVPLLALAIDTWSRSLVAGNPSVSRGWMAVTVVAALAFALLRTIKYRTRRLHVPGR